MRRFGIYLWRLCVLVSGFVLAMVGAAGFMLVIAYGGLIAQEPEFVHLYGFGMVALTPVITLYVASHSFAPAMIALLIAEFWSVRDSLYYMAAGGAIGAYGIVEMRVRVPEFNPSTIAAIIAAGAVGGFIFWLFAGRSAGKWAEVETATYSEPE